MRSAGCLPPALPPGLDADTAAAPALKETSWGTVKGLLSREIRERGWPAARAPVTAAERCRSRRRGDPVFCFLVAMSGGLLPATADRIGVDGIIRCEDGRDDVYCRSHEQAIEGISMVVG